MADLANLLAGATGAWTPANQVQDPNAERMRQERLRWMQEELPPPDPSLADLFTMPPRELREQTLGAAEPDWRRDVQLKAGDVANAISGKPALEAAGDVQNLMSFTDWLPVTGDFGDIADTLQSAFAGNWKEAAATGAMAVAPGAGAGIIAKAVKRKGARNALEEAADVVLHNAEPRLNSISLPKAEGGLGLKREGAVIPGPEETDYSPVAETLASATQPPDPRAGGWKAQPQPLPTPPATSRQDAIGAVNLRRMTPEQALETARRQEHIRPSPPGAKGEGAFIGAPYKMRSMSDLNNIRSAFDADVALGAGGADWYDRLQPWLEEVAGPDPEAQRELAQNFALFSSQADPEGNLGFSLLARNRNAMGDARYGDVVRTSAQGDKYKRSFDTGQDIFEPTSDTSKKTAIYAQSMDPTMADPTTGTNDIWHARAFGFTDESGAPWDAALSPQQHAWLDAETVLAVDRANRLKIGGRGNWTAKEVQAAAWVAKKGRAYAERQMAKKVGGLTPQGPISPQQMEEGIKFASQSYPEHAPKHTAQATHEFTPGATTGHRQDITEGTRAEREAYYKKRGWEDPKTGRDRLYVSQRPYVAKSAPMEGVFGGATNPGTVARPLVGTREIVEMIPPKTPVDYPTFAGKGQREIDPSSRQMLSGTEAYRSFVDAQDAGAASLPIKGQRAGRNNAYEVTLPGAEQDVRSLAANPLQEKLRNVVHYGGDRGIITDFSQGPPQLPVTGLRAERDVQTAMQKRFPGSDAEQVVFDNVYTPHEWDKAPRGQGIISEAMLNQLNEVQMDAFAKPEVKEEVMRAFLTDAGSPHAREDIQNARFLLAHGGPKALLDAVKRGPVKAAIAIGVMLPFATAGIAAERGKEDKR